jgi:hypothetical protein
MMLRLIHWFASKLQRRVISGHDGPYLTRHKIFGWMPGDERTWPVSVYLHRFHRPDEDRDAPHSHPWKWAVALVLAGGYTERRLYGTSGGALVSKLRRLGPLSVNVIRADDYHVVEQLHGDETWTLFVVGPRVKTWFFWVANRGPVPWKQHLQERGLEVT